VRQLSKALERLQVGKRESAVYKVDEDIHALEHTIKKRFLKENDVAATLVIPLLKVVEYGRQYAELVEKIGKIKEGNDAAGTDFSKHTSLSDSFITVPKSPHIVLDELSKSQQSRYLNYSGSADATALPSTVEDLKEGLSKVSGCDEGRFNGFIQDIAGKVNRGVVWWQQALDLGKEPCKPMHDRVESISDLYKEIENGVKARLGLSVVRTSVDGETGKDVYTAYVPYTKASYEATNQVTVANRDKDSRPYVTITVGGVKKTVPLLGKQFLEALAAEKVTVEVAAQEHKLGLTLPSSSRSKSTTERLQTRLPLFLQDCRTAEDTEALAMPGATNEDEKNKVAVLHAIRQRFVGTLGLIVLFAVFGGDKEAVKYVYDLPTLEVIHLLYLDSIPKSNLRIDRKYFLDPAKSLVTGLTGSHRRTENLKKNLY
jgi:hypothetical protein